MTRKDVETYGQSPPGCGGADSLPGAGRTAPRYVDALLEKGFEHIVVVDDGSGPDYRPIFDALAEMPGCEVAGMR